MKLNTLGWLAFALVIIGGINWGLVGLLNLDLVAKLFGSMPMLARAIYSLVGVAAVYMLLIFVTKK
jgi:uncharacterized protein